MSSQVNRISYFTEQAVKGENEHFEFTVVPGWGSNLISLLDKKTNCELLRVPETAKQFWESPELYGTPILFPPNRIENGAFTFEGRSYQLEKNEKDNQNHIHGFVHTKNWDVIKASATGDRVEVVTEFDSCKHGTVMRQFPHHFIIRMSYILEGNVLEKKAEIINRGSETMPLGFGFHTSFHFPEDSASLSLNVEKRWVTNERSLPTGELAEVQEKAELKNGISLNNRAFDVLYLAKPEADGTHVATIELPEKALKITYKTDENFKHWLLYHREGNQDFVCTEPYTWVTNAPNVTLQPSLTGLQALKAGDSKTFHATITVSSNH